MQHAECVLDKTSGHMDVIELNTGERGCHPGRQRNVVEPDHGDFFRYGDPAPVKRRHQADRPFIVEAKDGKISRIPLPPFDQGVSLGVARAGPSGQLCHLSFLYELSVRFQTAAHCFPFEKSRPEESDMTISGSLEQGSDELHGIVVFALKGGRGFVTQRLEAGHRFRQNKGSVNLGDQRLQRLGGGGSRQPRNDNAACPCLDQLANAGQQTLGFAAGRPDRQFHIALAGGDVKRLQNGGKIRAAVEVQ